MPNKPPKGKTLTNNTVPVENTAARQQGAEPLHPAESANKKFPIVAIGASAGGLEAFEKFFSAMNDHSGMAFVVIAHLDPTHISLLPELIQKRSAMKVHQIRSNQKILPNSIFVIPPNKNLTISNGLFQLQELPLPRGANLPIDSFFRSLAAEHGSNSVAVVLSGTGADGTLGLKAIKGEAGMVMVQDVESAKYDGMPRSAIATGLADFVLPPEKMADQLIRYTRYAAQNNQPLISGTEGRSPDALQKIYFILRTNTNHDFSLYKKNTICRRIERRMNLHQIDNIDDYASYLQSSEREVSILFKELLIGVTNFFRDAAAFDLLRDKLLANIVPEKQDEYTIRVWVAGCSSGEEAYSLAIILQEWMLLSRYHYNVQIFGTDIDAEAIAIARAGLYPESIEADVSPQRLQRYFVKEDSGQYRIKKSIREMLVFALQNVIRDPPFTKLDIISCRNLLIYLGPELQRKLLPLFHFSLKSNGLLFLGSSESIGQATELFSVLDKKWKIFARKALSGAAHPLLELPTHSMTYEHHDHETEMADNIKGAEELSALQLVETILQQSKTPPCAIINDQNNIIYIHGRTGRFLEPAEGKASVNIIEMARPGVKAALAAAIRKVAVNKQEIILRGLLLEDSSEGLSLDVTVKPILAKSIMNGLMMVLFEEKQKPAKNGKANPGRLPTGSEKRTLGELEQELQYSRENLQSTIEELETSNEELKSTNEELQSTNEELQSTNEEMETSKEELQSLNEESTTVNAELQSRINELSKAYDDMKNLLDSTDIATLFLNLDLCISRFTPMVPHIIPLTVTDIGRPVGHFSTSLLNVDLAEASQKVLEDLAIRESVAQTKSGEIFALKIRPYRTTNNRIDGVVITFDNITVRKQAEELMQESKGLYRTMFDMAQEAVVLINPQTNGFVECNQIAHEYLGYTREEFMQLSLANIEESELSVKLTKPGTAKPEDGKQTYATRHRSKDGKLHDVQVKAKSLTFDKTPLVLTTWRYS